jgi:restriction system protein
VEEQQRIATQHADIDAFQQDVSARVPQAVTGYFAMVLAASSYPEDFPHQTKLAYVPESKQLVVEHDVPGLEIIPETSAYKYVKSKDCVTEATRPLTQRKLLYASVIAQVTLRTLYELFRADRLGCLDTIVFNGYVGSVDKGTGHPTRICLVTVRTSRDVFTLLKLSQVDPIACLTTLNATLSQRPAELAPVRPVLEFSMVDPRFIEQIDVLSELDQRPNLMELTPTEFESLIANLFQKMGLETRQTQASRDGGVDCVAFDPRPIFGGKVVIQAKRYKHTVGVSAVRDLYGTMQNEGASKGILVTTSGYGKASYEFAEGKPLELLSGSHLLYLLKEHANIDAIIKMPDNWQDVQLDT